MEFDVRKVEIGPGAGKIRGRVPSGYRGREDNSRWKKISCTAFGHTEMRVIVKKTRKYGKYGARRRGVGLLTKGRVSQSVDAA